MAGAERGGPDRDRRVRGVLGVLLLLGGSAALVGAQVTSESKEVPEYKPVDIPCSAFRSSWSNPRIEWKFQKGSSLQLFYYGGELTEPYRNRVRFSPTSIHFDSVTREDSGKYICEVVGDGSQIAKSEVTLTVQVPPGKPSAHVPSSATVGSRVVLRCSEAQGSPPPTFRWYKDGSELPPDPRASPAFRNSSYTLDPSSGELVSQGQGAGGQFLALVPCLSLPLFSPPPFPCPILS
ncbi:LOW QUALITY PROTEIN: junctional adhesion molecule A-like, partial [Pseudopipra pipra]|uniref:LOW QUALITY PROTEIN: junctional adhesion molecule A-like n=1 Tax=Pseudopipra pipra TaxID=415032 RepID=UPI003138CFB8